MPKLRVAGITAVIAIACAAPPAQAPAPLRAPVTETRPVLRLVPMDSATIERLCAKPDSVRAGKAECVLHDQREPVRPLQRTSPPPPPPP